jgi:hypothetical protein
LFGAATWPSAALQFKSACAVASSDCILSRSNFEVRVGQLLPSDRSWSETIVERTSQKDIQGIQNEDGKAPVIEDERG